MYILDTFTDGERIFIRIDEVLYEVVEENRKKVLRLYASKNYETLQWEIGGWWGSYGDLKRTLTGE